ncbi:MAG: flavin reductase family protein [Planctomycetota bacterium]|nr:flavin reductase family protein [Planctomycetota bacterium]
MAKLSIDAVGDIWRMIDRTIWIVTASDGTRHGGLVATCVVQSSNQLAQPGVLVGLTPMHFTCDLVLSAGAYGLHLLRPDQAALAWNFCLDSGRERDKLAGLAVTEQSTGSPILNDCLAWMDCRVLTRYTAGDRVYFFSEVVAAQKVSEYPPLSVKQLTGGATAEQLQALQAGLEADIAAMEQARCVWRAGLNAVDR